MSIEFVKMKCESCGNMIDIDPNRKEGYCTYCGSKFMLVNSNEHIYRTVDEAQIRKIEAEERIKMAEFEQKKHDDKILIGMIIGMVLFIIIWRLLM